MAAYAALVSLSQTTLVSINEDTNLFSIHSKEKLRSIHEYVMFMLSFLEDFPQKAKRWEGRVRNEAHKIEDIILWQQMLSRHMSTIPPDVEFRNQLNEVTEEIGLIAGQMMEDRPDYLPSVVKSSSPSATPATTNNDAVIGFEKDQMAIKERLCGQSSTLQVVPIVGMAGIGKTTLATTIYEDPLILEHFEIRAWLTVSQDYSEQRILLGLLDSLNLLEEQRCGRNIDESQVEEEELCANSKEQVSREEIGESEMATKIYQILKWRRYLIVMDDVWNIEVLDDLMSIFPDDNNGSRIMLTTRLMDLATYSNPDSHFHQMQFMDECQSWDLLKHKVFRDGYCPSHLEDIGKEIAQKCAGLPLTIVLVAGVLSMINSTRALWEDISRNVNPVVEREWEEILSLSYTHLPHHLRPCFLLIGGFPEDEIVRASRLIKLWVAEGFLKHENECNKSLEEEAEEYLEDLVKRNLVVVTSRKSDGKIKNCSLHDMVRELCIRKAKEEKFLDVVDGLNIPQGMINGQRRISFNHSDVSGIWGPTIRTILCFRLQSSPSWLACLQGSSLLKVLNAVNSNHNEFPLPSQIFQLFHLTYLALIGSFSIPPAICKLVNLQTLIIHPTIRQRTRNSREYENASHFSLPLEIWRMQQLRHLILYDLYMLPHPPDELDHPLENLQTLLPLENLVWNEKMVRMIPNVKKLGLVNTLNQGYQLHHLNHLCQLEKLKVSGYGKFSWLAQVRKFPRTLKNLTLVGGGFPWADMSIIGSLPNLQVLKLRNRACDGVTWETTDDEFPELKYLLIDNSVLEQWVTQGSPFPRLRQLVLSYCWRLGKIPEGIGEISTLELIEVVGYRRSTLMKSVKQIKHHQQSFGDDALKICAVNHISTFERAGSRYNGISLMSAVQHCRQFSFTEICSSTGYFSDTYLLGCSNWGEVYKGFIDDGSVTVAIKRLLSNLNEGETEFAAKMETLSKVQHHNLVSLIGYCSEHGERVLIYDYMNNGSLGDHINNWSRNSGSSSSSLMWNQLLKICIGAAQGLDYLHSVCSIIHHNIKPTNILLDESFTTKITDFGLAPHLHNSEGRFKFDPYTDPSYINTNILTMESDVYAFGVVLLVVLAGAPAYSAIWFSENSFSGWVQDIIRLRRVDDRIVDQKFRGEISEDCLKTFVGVVKKCLHRKPKKRPKMSRVLAQLELALQQQERREMARPKLLFRQIWNKIIAR